MDIIAYTFEGYEFCPAHIIEELIHIGQLSPGARSMPVEEALDQWAEYMQVDRNTADSMEAPMSLHRVQVGSAEYVCAWCGETLGGE